MRIMAIIHQVPHAEESVKIRNGAVDLEDSTLVMDTMDEYGVEEAIRLRETGADAEIIVLAAGSKRTEEALRAALAMGADRAIHIETDCALDAVALSQVAAQIACTEQVELIFCGGQQSASDSDALGAATAEWLQWPQATWTNALELKGRLLVGRHDLDDGSETFELPLPAVVTTQQGLNEPRYPTLPNIMKSRKKEIHKEDLRSFGATVRTKSNGVEIQVRERLGKILDGKDASVAAHQLVQMLRTQARVIA
jgi:electron transfer flavoprotein beta subunit